MDVNNKKLFNEIVSLKPVVWNNSNIKSSREGLELTSIGTEAIYEAEKRLIRFAPLIKKLFPETEDGIIESPLVEIASMKKEIEEVYKTNINGKLFLKCDNLLKIAGSVKARGGIYEVLKHTEELAIKEGLLNEWEDYSIIAGDDFKNFYSNYNIAVGSTGNLGLSIGIISATLGFMVTVHMSRDAKEWKKELLRSKGVKVIEYEDDYSKAVEQGRKQCEDNKRAYFIDDENSLDLFMGYSVAALRLKKQLEGLGIVIDDKHKLRLYLPCGVGGAPSGITFGVKHIFGDNACCYFVEPTHSPCMLLGQITGKYNSMHVNEYGIDNKTEADGLAVGSPSKLASKVVEYLVDGEYTIQDNEMFKLLVMLKDSENIKLEVSAASSLKGPVLFNSNSEDIHIAWATGGLFLPENLYEAAYRRGKFLMSF
jgi:D-serine dehydratase